MTEPSQNRQRCKVLVISERFPPDVHGGAELSLADTLAHLDRREWDVKVVALHAAERRAADVADSVERLTCVKEWPPGLGALHARLADKPRFLLPILSSALKLVLSVRFVFSAGIGKWRRLRQLILHWRSRSGDMPPYDVDHEALACPDPVSLVRLQEILTEFKPDIIHADNTDAVMLASKLERGAAALVTMVRDHRFFCAHASQQMTVGESACNICEFGCLQDVYKLEKMVLRAEMEAIRADRQNALAVADQIVSTSVFLTRQVEAFKLGVPVHAIGNPYPGQEGHPAAGAACVRRSSVPRVLFVGALQARKGPQLVADCFAAIAAQVANVTFDFAGQGPMEDYILSCARDVGLEDRVNCLGFLDRPSLFRAISSSWVVVTPTLWPEPFGRLPLEVGMLRRPIIASRLGGHCETVSDGVTGMLIEPGNRDALASALVSVLTDRGKGERMGEAAYGHVTGQFAPEVISERLATIWRAAGVEVRV